VKMLAVMGSPRKGGNTDILVSRIAQGARAGGAEVEIVRLGECSVQECNGCHACWRTGVCSKNDDMRRLYPRIIEAEVIVFGTPVYWYGPTALMKAFIDRFVYFNCPENRPGVRGKKAVVALVLEEDNQATWQPVLDFFNKSLTYLEMTLAETVVVPGVGGRGEITGRPDRLEQAEQLGRTLAADGL
jgi:multimeric flavodoxin WrbA